MESIIIIESRVGSAPPLSTPKPAQDHNGSRFMSQATSSRSGKPKRVISIGLMAAGLALAPAPPARAQTPVAIELVLAVDTSLSVDDTEYDLQMTGIANAFRSPEVGDLIQAQDGVAVALFQWSTTIDPRFVIPWHLLRGPASVAAFADRVARARRDPHRGFTAIGRAIDFAVRLIAANDFDGRRLKIDVSGDGRNNTGPVPAASWPGTGARGIGINGLPILIDTYNLDAYFRTKVIHGPGAFIETATDYRDFARAFRRKLRRELSPLTSRACIQRCTFALYVPNLLDFSSPKAQLQLQRHSQQERVSIARRPGGLLKVGQVSHPTSWAFR